LRRQSGYNPVAMSFRSRVICVSALAGLLCFSSAATVRVSAWGAVGHHIVGRLAWALMNPAAQDRVAALLNGRQDVFVAAATWADEVREARPETYNWHFVDILVGDTRYDAARDCPATVRGDCVIAAIARARAEVVDASRSAELRAESLKFIIHFVGDLHQPLHSIDNRDRGGNDVRVNALRGEQGRATNLHAVWDTGLINLSPETEAARADRLLADLRANPVTTELDVVKWVEESHDVGVRVVYRYPSFSAGGPSPDPITLDDAYRTAAIAVIDRRLQLAGVRLAALIDSLLGK
jgi:hypothetical protein